MSTPARLAYTNVLTVSGVVITSSADATGYPASNLSNPARWKKWRSSTTTGDQWVKFDLGASKSFQLLAAINATLHTGGTLKAQANATDAWVTPTVSDTFVVPSTDFTRVLTDWISVQNLRWVRFYFTNVGAVSSYVELGAAFAGTYIEPANNLAPGMSLQRIDQSQQRFAIGGQRSTVTRAKYHDATGMFRLQSASARDALRTAFETNGTATPCIFAVDAASPGLIFYGTMQEMSAGHRPQMVDRWDVPFHFVEDVS